MMAKRDGLIPRERAEKIILVASPAALVRTAAVASGQFHEGRADLDLTTGEVVMGHSEVGTAGRVTLWSVAAGVIEFPEEDFEDGEALDVDDLEMLGAELYALENPPAVSAEEVLAGALAALDGVYGKGADDARSG